MNDRDSIDLEPSEGRVASPVISVRGLGAGYGRKEVVHDVSFELERGSALAVLGRNGAGKSTLVQSVLGLRPVATGQVEVFGLDPWRQRQQVMTRTGAVLERPHLPADATLGSLTRCVVDLRPGLDLAALDARVAGRGLSSRARFAALSRGQQTQFCLELALAPAPELLVLDDPLLGLDVVARAAILERLAEALAEGGLTLLVTSHDLDAVERLATHIGFLDRGNLTVNEPIETLTARHQRIVGADTMDPAALPWPVREVGEGFGRQLVTAEYQDGVSSPPGVSVEPLTLEEIFVLQTTESRPTRSSRSASEEAA